jgi:hypothetical protein
MRLTHKRPIYFEFNNNSWLNLLFDLELSSSSSLLWLSWSLWKVKKCDTTFSKLTSDMTMSFVILDNYNYINLFIKSNKKSKKLLNNFLLSFIYNLSRVGVFTFFYQRNEFEYGNRETSTYFSIISQPRLVYWFLLTIIDLSIENWN